MTRIQTLMAILNCGQIVQALNILKKREQFVIREHCRKAGQTKSIAKAKAARRNGKLGGRPKKEK